MKKFLSILFGAIIAFSAANCSATVPIAEIAIGGMRPGMTAQEIISIAGQPLSKNSKGNEWYYESFNVEFDDNLVEEIKIRQSSLSTPSGVFVGYQSNILTKLYGAADEVENKREAMICTYYSADYSLEMNFKIRNGIIEEITCEVND